MIKRFLIIYSIVFYSLAVHATKVEYLHQDLPLNEIQNSKEWNAYQEKFNEGFDNGVYWFKIDLERHDVPNVLVIPESHISRATLYSSSIEIPKDNELTRYVKFKIPPSKSTKTYYLKVDCLLEARIPIEVISAEKHYKDEMIAFLIMGLYVGIVVCIMLINLFSYFSFGNKTYIHYMFMVLGMSVNAFYKDGLTALIFGLDGANEVLEAPLNSIVVISSLFFTVSYLALGDQYKKAKIAGITTIVLAVVCNIIYQFTGSFLSFTLVHIFHLLTLDIFWGISLFMWKKSHYAKFFALAYGLPLLFAHDYYISPHFGVEVLGLPLTFYKLGSVFEMVVFTYAIMYQARKLADDNLKMRREIVDYTNKLKEQNKDLNSEQSIIGELIMEYNFTQKEIEVLKALSEAKTNKEIGNEQFISENTVKFHIKNIFNKLQVNNRQDAGKKYIELDG